MTDPGMDVALADELLELGCLLEGIRAAASKELGLTPQQAQLLSSVAPAALTHGELAVRLHCDKTNVTGLVDRLERRGLVERRPSLSDRRVTQVALAEGGEALVARFRMTVRAAVNDRLSAWPAARRRRLATLAQGAVEAIRAHS